MPKRAATTRARAPVRGRRAWRFPLALFLLAVFALKATVLVQLGNHPLLQPHGELDTAFYIELAQKIAAGGPLAVPEPLFVSPLYVYVLALVFGLGGSVRAAQVIQIVLGTAAVGLLFSTTRQWFGERAAWLAAGLAALTGIFTFSEILILQAALDPFLVSLTLYLVSKALAQDRWGIVVAAGAAAGLLALNRPNVLPYGLVVGVALAYRAWRQSAPSISSPALGRALLFPAALLLVLATNGLRNYAASGEWITIASHGGLNFYIGNHAGANGIYSPVPGISASIAGQARDARHVAEQAVGRTLSAGEVSDYFFEQAWSWIASQPGAAMRLFARKLALLVNRVEIPLNFSYAYYGREPGSLLRVMVVGAWMLVPLGLLGLVLPSARQTRRGYWVWASFIPIYGLTVAIFFVTDRYRMPLLLPLCASAAAALVWAWDQVTARRAAPLVAAALVLTILAALANWPLGLDEGRGFEETRWAVWLIEQGRFDEARAYVARVAPAQSHAGVLHFRVGRAFASASRFNDAIEHFEQALAIDRGQAAIELALGQALTVTKRPREAVPHLSAALDAGHRPEIAGPWLVRALAAAGERDQAVALIARLPDAVAVGPDTALDLGTIALELHAAAVAERWLSLAVTVDPSRAEAHLNLAIAYATLGRLEDARAHAEEARRLDPHEPRADVLLKALGRKQRAP